MRLLIILTLLPFFASPVAFAEIEENTDPVTHLAYIPENAPPAETDPTQVLPTLQTATALASSLNEVDDVWQRIRAGFAMEELDSPLIARHENWYASRPDYVLRMSERARRYLFYIVEEVERRGMPSEIALLPMIESAFNPVAYSSSHASGIWQFIPSTGKHFGLQQNWWYDGRRDIISATEGALDYLQKLHDQFQDWHLALAAYNCGEGAVSRAQARNRRKGLPTDYAHLKLPAETRNYVPKLLAIKHIVSDPESFGLTLAKIPNRPYFGAVVTTRHMDRERVAELAGISLEEFTALNPGHHRPVILQDGDNILLLPVESLATFVDNLDRAEGRLVSWKAYYPKKGERLDRLAPRFGLTVERLKAINGLSARTKVSNGQALLVPIADEEDEIEFVAFNTQLPYANEDHAMRTLRHIVRRGETLASIARKHHVSAASIVKLNGGTRKFRVGQSIVIAHTSRLQRVHRKRTLTKRPAQPLARQTGKPRNIKVAANR